MPPLVEFSNQFQSIVSVLSRLYLRYALTDIAPSPFQSFQPGYLYNFNRYRAVVPVQTSALSLILSSTDMHVCRPPTPSLSTLLNFDSPDPVLWRKLSVAPSQPVAYSDRTRRPSVPPGALDSASLPSSYILQLFLMRLPCQHMPRLASLS